MEEEARNTGEAMQTDRNAEKERHQKTNEETGVDGSSEPSQEIETIEKNKGLEGFDPENGTSEDYYFSSYSHFGIHEEMLKDTVRTNSYRNAILRNSHLFKDKIVLDVGCGTGILSLFAAQAGAKHVYGVDCSDIAYSAMEIVAQNGFKDTVTILKEKMEDVKLPVDKVDIIISEWMGYFLLYESMLNTVIHARDKFLKEDGLIFPDRATLYVQAIEDGDYKEEKIDFWDDVYGFDFNPIKKLAILEPLVDYVDSSALSTTAFPLLKINIANVQESELDFSTPFVLQVVRDDFIHAFIAYFDVTFSHCHKPLSFSTGPEANSTHWKQTVFYLDKTLLVYKGNVIKGRITAKQNERNKRDLDIVIKYEVTGGKVVKGEQKYRLR